MFDFHYCSMMGILFVHIRFYCSSWRHKRLGLWNQSLFMLLFAHSHLCHILLPFHAFSRSPIYLLVSIFIGSRNTVYSIVTSFSMRQSISSNNAGYILKKSLIFINILTAKLLHYCIIKPKFISSAEPWLNPDFSLFSRTMCCFCFIG